MLLVQSQKWKHQNNVWNLFKVNDRHQTDVKDVTMVFLLITLSRFHTFPDVSYVDFELVKTGSEISVAHKLTWSYRFTKANSKLISPTYLYEIWNSSGNLSRDFFKNITKPSILPIKIFKKGREII